MGKIIGLDIGVASVGWAVVENDENAKIIELGSNIFDEATAANNMTRRQMRQTRRLLRRKKNRIKTFNKLWIKTGFNIKIQNINNQLELRVKALTDELTVEQLYAVLVNLLKHRGISYLDDVEDDDKTSSDYSKSVQINTNELKTKSPCQIQLERLISNGKYRGTSKSNVDGEEVSLINVFTTSSYIKEALQILNCQKQYSNKITDSFINDYIELIKVKREYFVGPGNEKSRTDYGRWTTKKDDKGNYITENNIFEKLIGKSSFIFGNETEEKKLRASSASYTAQEFNILNDLNNIIIGGRKLTKKEKLEIIEKLKNQDTVELKYNKIEKIIADVSQEDINSIRGNRIDRDENPEYHSFKIFRFMKKKLSEIGCDYDSFSRDEKDRIAHILTINTEKEEILKQLKQSGIVTDENIREKLVEIRKKNPEYYTKWHSFSLKVMNYLIPYMYEESKEQMSLITDELNKQTLKRNVMNVADGKYINKKVIVSEIYNPVVRRSISITIDILNALIKKYHDIEKVVIEMPRDKNSDDEKKRIKDTNKKNEQELNNIKNRLINDYSITQAEEKLKRIKNLAMKLKLWEEQEECCIYSGQHIDVDDLINNPNNYEIDHIIPISISFDDSRNNKVLVKQTENQKKKNMTPVMYLNTVKREYNLEQFVQRVKYLQKKGKINKKKMNNLLFDEDITKIDVLQGFISRNINDTRYASRVILNSCKDYFSSHNSNVKVSVIRGSFTSQMRKNLSIKKDREEDYSHHAIDAVIICYSQMGYDAYKYIDLDTGEIIDNEKLEAGISENDYNDIMYNTKWKLRKDNIVEAHDRVKYWYRVDKKVNRQLCNQTIRGTRLIDGIVYKINSFDIYNTKKADLEKKLIDKKENLLMYRYDRKTYENLILLFERYKDASNPFVEAKKNGEIAKKYAKDNNGTPINSIKYLDGEVGSCIDISHKFGFEKGTKKVILESLNPYRSDIYYNKALHRYAIVGLRYSDLKCKNNKYIIGDENYIDLLYKEGIIKENQDMKDINNNGYEFMFSLYKNDLFEYVDVDEEGKEILKEYRFLSRNNLKSKAQVEVKPINRAKYTKEIDGFVQNFIRLSKVKKINKLSLNILGDRFIVKNEKFRNVIDF